ncbi:hypothetical protein [Rufibacter quisquiliarum]|nr:hypothetical protein [Rufibacter quisquiliarum]
MKSNNLQTDDFFKKNLFSGCFRKNSLKTEGTDDWGRSAKCAGTELA